MSYLLVGEIHAHEGAIRSIGVISHADSGAAQYLLTGGADACVRVWDAATYALVATLSHDHSVTAIEVDHQHRFIITGCMDSNIRIYNFEFNEIARLEGHSKGVISLSVYEDLLVSGSWDGTARLWNLLTFECEKCFEGHENGVHVLALADGKLITTSTGEAVNNKPCHFFVRVWDMRTSALLLPPCESHDASIRSIKNVPDIGFVTSANDGSVRLFTYECDLIETMCHPMQEDGSPPFLMDVAVLSAADLELVSVGEDSSVVVWKHGSLEQSIPHPCSMWCVQGVQGEILTGAHDGCLRVFSRDMAKTSSDLASALQISFEVEVQDAISRRNKGPSAEDLAKAPKWDTASSRPGTSEAQVGVFNKDGRLIAAQWSSASGAWVEMGEVVGGPERREDVLGVPYDMVLPVEMEGPNGDLHLKLGYNNGENPFVAAQRFIEQNGLDQSFLAQVADWVIQRTGQTAPVLGSVPSAPSAVVGDPTKTASSGGHASKLLPLTTYFFFDDVPSGLRGKLLPKLQDMNGGAGKDALSASDFDLVVSCAATLEATNRYHSSEISGSEVAAVIRMTSWDAAKVAIPLDLLRMVSAHPHGSNSLAASNKLQSLFARLQALIGDSALSQTVLAVLLRFMCNCFRFDKLRKAIVTSPALSGCVASVVSSSLSAVSAGGNKNAKSAYVNLLANISASAADSSEACVGLFESAVSASKVLLKSDAANMDTLRCVVLAVGTVLVLSRANGKMKGLKSELDGVLGDLNEAIGVAGAQLTGDTKEAVDELLALLKA